MKNLINIKQKSNLFIIISCLIYFSIINFIVPTNKIFAAGSADFQTITPPTLESYGATSWANISSNLITLMLQIAGAALIVVLLVGGVMYITSAGNEEQAGKAQKAITGAIIGIVVITVAYAIIEMLAGAFK